MYHMIINIITLSKKLIFEIFFFYKKIFKKIYTIFAIRIKVLKLYLNNLNLFEKKKIIFFKLLTYK